MTARLDDRPDGRWFAERAATYEIDTRWVTSSTLADRIAATLPALQPGDRAVDVGAGTGHLVRHLARRTPAQWFSIDAEAAMVRRHPAGRRAVADGVALCFRGGTFATAVARSVLHYTGLDGGLRELHRVVAPGGSVVAAQKVSDGFVDDVEWYRSVQELRSVTPRERMSSDDLRAAGERARLHVAEHHRHLQRVTCDRSEWASRGGYFDDTRTRLLHDLAAHGADPDFAARTGFELCGSTITMTLVWAIVRWTVPAQAEGTAR